MGGVSRRSADRVRLTEWLRGAEREPSGFAGGRPMSNRAWLDCERARVDKLGVGCEVRENPAQPGYFALFRK